MSIDIREVSIEDYANSVITLLNMVNQHVGTSSSIAAVQVLLSTYNGNEWHMNLTDLCCFDHVNLTHAMNIMIGRATHFTEPHELVKDGDEHFGKLWDKYYRLHVGNRNLAACSWCRGYGSKWIETDDEEYEEECTHCQGCGKIDEPSWKHHLNVTNGFKGKEHGS